MLPRNNELRKKAKFFLLEEGDLIEESDEYYNNIKDEWLPVENDFIGNEFRSDESKPVRRKNKREWLNEEEKETRLQQD